MGYGQRSPYTRQFEGWALKGKSLPRGGGGGACAPGAPPTPGSAAHVYPTQVDHFNAFVMEVYFLKMPTVTVFGMLFQRLTLRGSFLVKN